MSRILSIPVSPYRSIEVQFPNGPLTQRDWEVLMDVLASMYPALVEQKPEGEA